MLANILAIAVGLSSLYLLSTAFIAVDRHRSDDFLWGAVGLFYALVLWLCAGRITGAILLGQVAAAVLVIAFGWQTLKLRQALLYPDQPVKLFSVVDWLQGRLGRVTAREQPKASTPPKGKETPKETSPVPVAETVTPVAETGKKNGETQKASLPMAEIFDDFEDEEDFDLEAEEPADSPASIDPKTATLEVTETVTLTLEVPESAVPTVEAFLDEMTTEAPADAAENASPQN